VKEDFIMDKPLRMFPMFTVAVFALALSACGAVHNRVLTPPDNLVALKQVTLLPVEVVSKEQNPDALSLNAQWQTMATAELQSLLASKNIAASSDSQAAVGCRIEVTYGNRALRYFVGFGAGAGHMRVTVELKDSTGTVRYAAKSEADLAIGLFGGSMSNVARKTIQEAIKEFAAHL
jgi:hypothetical protein